MINQTELTFELLKALATFLVPLFSFLTILTLTLNWYEKKLDRDDLIKYPNQIKQFNRTPYV